MAGEMAESHKSEKLKLSCPFFHFQDLKNPFIPDLRISCTFNSGKKADSVKELPANAGDRGSVLGWGRASGEGNGNPLQYSCLVNSMDGGAWRDTVHGVIKSRTGLRD